MYFDKIEALAFEGGGTKGAAYIGVIEKLEQGNVLSSINRFAGTSAGAHMASMIAFGYDSDILKIALKSLICDDVFDADCCCFTDCACGNVWSRCNGLAATMPSALMRLIFNLGYFKGAYIENTLDMYFSLKLQEYAEAGKISLPKHRENWQRFTFKELYDYLGKDLRLAAVDLNERELVYLSHKTCPNMPVCVGARASGALPFVFRPVQWKGEFLGESRAMCLCDGALISNIPINAFGAESGKTLAFDLVSDEDVKTLGASKISGLFSYSSAIISTIWEHAQESSKTSNEKIDYVKIDVKDATLLDLDMDADDIEDLIHAGRSAINDYLKSIDT